MFCKTDYTLKQHGVDIELRVIYEYREDPADLLVLYTCPVVDLSPDAMEEVELHCWSDISETITALGHQTCEENAIACSTHALAGEKGVLYA